jgi:hypothetical protein
MEQRRPRLGDILDDYCPRERRLSNHVVVAMIGEDVKQTRCTTCDAEHPYKHAKVPPRRKAAPSPPALLETAPPRAAERPRLNGESPVPVVAAPVTPPGPAASPEAGGVELPASPAEEPQPVDDGPVHRPLIRATLPRPEGEAKERPIPEFTMRAARSARGFRNGGGRFAKNGGGQRQAAAAFRPGVMETWSPFSHRQRGGGQPLNRPPQQRSHGNKKSR